MSPSFKNKGRALRTKETLLDFHEKYRVTQHSQVFRGLTGSQRTPGIWGVQARQNLSPPILAIDVSHKPLAFPAVGVGHIGASSIWKEPVQWVEAEPLATITEQKIRNFVWRSIICKFGIPRALVSDNGKQFDNPKFRDFCAELWIKNYYSSPAHPQSNGQAEVTIRTLKATLKTKLENLKGKWVEYLPQVLWAYKTTHKSVTRETP